MPGWGMHSGPKLAFSSVARNPDKPTQNKLKTYKETTVDLVLHM